MKKPNFLIVGAARSGTTALYHFLSKHQDISMPSVKEPRYFSSLFKKFPQNGKLDYVNDNAMIKDRLTYFSLYKSFDTKLIGEASPDYLYYANDVIPQIKKELGDVKIIILLRDPVMRSISAYNHLIRDSREKLSFKMALEEEKNRILNNYDFMWHYTNVSLYYKQVKLFKDNFTNVKVIISEDFKIQTEKVYNEILNFLEINKINDNSIDFNLNFNPVGKPSNNIIKFFLRRDLFVTRFIRNMITFIFPNALIQNIASKFLKKQDISDNLKRSLFQLFKDDILKIEKLLDINLDKWKTY